MQSLDFFKIFVIKPRYLYVTHISLLYSAIYSWKTISLYDTKIILWDIVRTLGVYNLNFREDFDVRETRV